jgi:cell wall-associated NlpC family hydrolase
MIRYLLIAFVFMVLFSACGSAQKGVRKSDYPEFVWDDEHKPVHISRSDKAEKKEPEKTSVRHKESDLLSVVESWLGTPYKWGGTTKEGTDCSGFALRIYEEAFNAQLPGRRAEDFFQLVEVKDESEARPGDLVFFKINNKI